MKTLKRGAPAAAPRGSAAIVAALKRRGGTKRHRPRSEGVAQPRRQSGRRPREGGWAPAGAAASTERSCLEKRRWLQGGDRAPGNWTGRILHPTVPKTKRGCWCRLPTEGGQSADTSSGGCDPSWGWKGTVRPRQQRGAKRGRLRSGIGRTLTPSSALGDARGRSAAATDIFR